MRRQEEEQNGVPEHRLAGSGIHRSEGGNGGGGGEGGGGGVAEGAALGAPNRRQGRARSRS